MKKLAKDLIEQICFEARSSEYVDEKSGVSARLSITAYENLLSSAELRTLKSKGDKTIVRLSDFLGIIPAITGKIELVYEGEQEGSDFVANHLFESAIKTLFSKLFPKIKKLEKEDEVSPYEDIINWFFESNTFKLINGSSDEEYKKSLNSIIPLENFIHKYQPDCKEKDILFLKEFVLWGMVQFKKLSKVELNHGFEIQDPYGNFIKNI